MTRARTRLAAGALTTALLGLASGCGAVTGDETETAAGPPRPNLLEKGELSVCTDMPYEPFEFEKKDGSPAGFDVDLVQHVADRLGVELRMVDTSFDDISSGDSLNNGKCDLAISAMTITKKPRIAIDTPSMTLVSRSADTGISISS